MSTSEDNNNGVDVKADTLCGTGANATEAFWATDQQSHPGNKEPLDMSNRLNKGPGLAFLPNICQHIFSSPDFYVHHIYMFC